MTAGLKSRRASAEEERYWQESMAALSAVTKRYPNITVLEVLAMLGRAAGYSLAACFPTERDLARECVINNMDSGLADLMAGRVEPAYDPKGKA